MCFLEQDQANLARRVQQARDEATLQFMKEHGKGVGKGGKLPKIEEVRDSAEEEADAAAHGGASGSGACANSLEVDINAEAFTNPDLMLKIDLLEARIEQLEAKVQQLEERF